MRNNSTAANNVIPFEFEARQVRTLLIDEQPWFCIADICRVLGYANSRDAVGKHCREKGVAKRDTLTTRGKQSLTFIDEGNLYRLIIKSRKEEAQRFEAWVCDEVLPAIRKHGRYEDRSNTMATVLGSTIGTDGFRCLGAVVGGKVHHLPAPVRRRATMHIWSQVHKAFSVVSGQDIPADQMDSARNFIAAYSLDGEWLPKEKAAEQFSDWLNLNALITFMQRTEELWDKHGLYRHLTHGGSRVGVEMLDYVRDGGGVARMLKREYSEQLNSSNRIAREACDRALAATS